MHHTNHARPYYTGSPHHRHESHPGTHRRSQSGHHGFCHSCCHPHSKCCCASRECRKESKELLVEPDRRLGDASFKTPTVASHLYFMAPFVMREVKEKAAADGTAASKIETHEARLEIGRVEARVQAGMGKAFIGGGCCVHLSIEYTAAGPSSNLDSAVLVIVQDSEDTILAWMKKASADDGYQVKECIVTTKPGAHLTVIVVNMTARVRWCEIFSC